MGEELKCCPFCGCEAFADAVETLEKEPFWYVVCDTCYSSSDGYITEELAIKAWNQRA